ncbi:MAG: GNAT family N-acetyltransferase [Treponemataceae bacterium]|nr:GNAT family N-acetyltransferase [Treponemataceae bacterium]
MEANKNLTFKNITDFPRGTLAALLKDGYAFEPKFAQYWQTQWQAFDDFFYDNPRIAEKYGFVTVLDDEPIGLVSWDPKNLPESAEVGHNCIATSHKGNGYGTRQMREAVNRIIAQGAKRVVVWTNERLTAARCMYERIGFTYIATSAETICPECAGQRIHYEMRLAPISTQQEYLK